VNLTSGQIVNPEAGDRDAAARIGISLLRARAETDWIHRRMQQLEFIDTQAVRWRVSVECFIPDSAPAVSVGRERLRLIPITDLPKGEFPIVNHGDRRLGPVWLPHIGEITQLLASALIYMASSELGTEPEHLPELLEEEIRRIVAADPGGLTRFRF
jgi:hypothetical protein